MGIENHLQIGQRCLCFVAPRLDAPHQIENREECAHPPDLAAFAITDGSCADKGLEVISKLRECDGSECDVPVSGTALTMSNTAIRIDHPSDLGSFKVRHFFDCRRIVFTALAMIKKFHRIAMPPPSVIMCSAPTPHISWRITVGNLALIHMNIIS